MSSVKLPPFILEELPNISNFIHEPLKGAQRIKYTCFDVSKTFVVFGATSGGIYIFNRYPCSLIQLLPSTNGAITTISISLDEKYIAYANGKGIVTVTCCKQDQPSNVQKTTTSKEHQGNEVSAMTWSQGLLFIGDDVGRVSVLQMPTFTTTMFQSSSRTILRLESRVCQLDARGAALAVSTRARCYVCDAAAERYRPVGRRPRDGLYGACFAEAGGRRLVYCARPSCRLWEAEPDGSVRRTRQYKHALAGAPSAVVGRPVRASAREHRPCNFPKLFDMDRAIFTFERNALYFLNKRDVEHTAWYEFEDIADCKVHGDDVYVWLVNGSLVALKYVDVERYLCECYVGGKYALCGELCALYAHHLTSDDCQMSKLYVLAGLREKLADDGELLERIAPVLDRCEAMAPARVQTKSGIYVVDNAYRQLVCTEDSERDVKSTTEPLQALRELTTSVTDKLSSGKKMLKEKWEGLEGRVKSLSLEREEASANSPARSLPPDTVDDDIVYKESSQEAEAMPPDCIKDKERICKLLYQQFRLSLTSDDCGRHDYNSTVKSYSCDIKEIYKLMLALENYCKSINAIEDSAYIPNRIFLNYINETRDKSNFLEEVIQDEQLYKYFVDSCISVNVGTHKLSNLSCDCGYPLPYTSTNQTPEYSTLIDLFVEMQWSSRTREQCYEVCKRMPYLWRKILYLRRNEDLETVLGLVLQMLDERLLHSFLPQFTTDTWERAVRLYATLYGNVCLNCGKRFDGVIVRERLGWDQLGGLMVKSVGGRTAARIMERHAHLIATGDVTLKFYRGCLLATLYEKYDGTIVGQLIDTLYEAHDHEDARHEISKLLRDASDGNLKNTSLPLMVAATSKHWGLTPLGASKTTDDSATLRQGKSVKNVSFQEILDNIAVVSNGVLDCGLCGLPLVNAVLIKDGGLWAFKCGHIYHGACLALIKVKLCPCCIVNNDDITRV